MTGSAPELGSWKSFGHHNQMKWHPGHDWTLETIVSSPYFSYKYVVLNPNNRASTRWEEGMNRVADLKVLKYEQTDSVLKIDDEWERFIVKFSIYYPLKEDEVMRINGSADELGSWNKLDAGPRVMTQGGEVTWLTGEKVKPWEYTIRLR